MTIYKLSATKLEPIRQTTFVAEGIKERQHLQRLLRDQIGVVSPDTLVVSEEFGDWQDSRRRIDLLGLDKEANLVVIELKRTEDGGYMELQGLRYAAMVSTLTFSKVVEIYDDYLSRLGHNQDAGAAILDFLGWNEPEEDLFAQQVRIVLVSAEFSKELTTSVIWLNDNGLDIRCVRLRPYADQGKVLLDVQQVIPLPEAQEYQVQVRDKQRRERISREQSRDFTKYDVTLGDVEYERLPKRQAIFRIVKFLCDSGVDPEEIENLFEWRRKNFRWLEGRLNSEQFREALTEQMIADGVKPDPGRFFIADDELIYKNDMTFALTKMWGTRTAKAMDLLIEKYGNYPISYSENRRPDAGSC